MNYMRIDFPIDYSIVIDTGKRLIKKKVDLDSFIAQMVKEHFQGAKIGIIKKMLEWAEYPTLMMIDLIDLKTILGIGTLEEYNRLIFYSGLPINHVSPLMVTDTTCWSDLVSMVCKFTDWTKESIGFGRHDGYRLVIEQISHELYLYARCTNIIHSLWNKRVDYDALTDEIRQLKCKNEALEYQLESKQHELRRLTSKISIIEHSLPTEIVEYDYEAIKERLNPIRDELNIVQRTFRRIIHAQYKVPIAVLVGKN